MKGNGIHAAIAPDDLPVCSIIGSADEHDPRKLIPLIEETREERQEARGGGLHRQDVLDLHRQVLRRPR